MHFKSKPRDHWHECLGVPDDATRDEIKAAYKKLALQWHPDRHSEDKNLATAKFVEINNAYRIIMRERHFELANASLQTRTSTEYKIPNTPRTRDSSTTLRTLSSSSRQSSFESVTTAPSFSRFSMRNASTSCDTLPSMTHGNSPSYPRAPPPQSIRITSTERHPFRNWLCFTCLSSTFASVGVGTSREWKYSLTLTLEELFQGRSMSHRITPPTAVRAKVNVVSMSRTEVYLRGWPRASRHTRARGAIIGSQVVCGAGMPIWFNNKVVGRGNLVVHWEIQMPHVSRWDNFRSTFGFGRR
ncbi:hypothetical protein BDP27DRAFT_1340263 [Rhodocollybia butyracea]|uniref:J domain-containing protein n=1 Tax=Rhodocollybia butyracea TaxID=206335 RepID=A0A9P5PA37_9AGAR|nr:hypothetical protein BDP27DRAFT_1340263 [Rhodocollybia butyracea]